MEIGTCMSCTASCLSILCYFYCSHVIAMRFLCYFSCNYVFAFKSCKCY